jgi:hypothetical protein
VYSRRLQTVLRCAVSPTFTTVLNEAGSSSSPGVPLSLFVFRALHATTHGGTRLNVSSVFLSPLFTRVRGRMLCEFLKTPYKQSSHPELTKTALIRNAHES